MSGRPRLVQIITDEAVRELVSGFLKALANAHESRQRFLFDLQERFGISENTAKNWVCGANIPEGLNLLKLFADYPELANRVLALCGLVAVRIENVDRSPEVAVVLERLRPYMPALEAVLEAVKPAPAGEAPEDTIARLRAQNSLLTDHLEEARR